MNSAFCPGRLAMALGTAVVMAVSISSCRITDPDGQPDALLELARRQHQWERVNVRDYQFDYSVAAFAQIQPVRIEVGNGTIYRVTNLTTGQPVPNPSSYPTIDSLFRTAASVLANSNYDPHISYDRDYGFPTEIDAASMMPDAGFTVMARNFVVLTLWNTTNQASAATSIGSTASTTASSVPARSRSPVSVP